MKNRLLFSHACDMRLCRGLVAVFLLAGGITTPARAQCSAPQQAKISAPDAAVSDFFGYSVAISGDTALVRGKFYINSPDSGSTYFFVRTGGVWTQQAELITSDAGQNGPFFCNSAAISGDTALVGARYGDAPGVPGAGAAYVFVRSGGVWAQQARLTASDAAANDEFGVSVAVSGDTALVGAWADDNAIGTNAGAAYVFVRSGGIWTQQAKLIPPGTPALFGFSVALSGDTALISAHRDHNAGGIDAGAAYIFVRNGLNWSQQAKLIASDGAPSDFFGKSVALFGDTALIGVPDSSNAGQAGVAYVFVRSGGVWMQQQELTASDAAMFDGFGRSVALSGDSALIGANLDDHAGGANAGSAYLFVRSGGVWAQQVKLTASDSAANDGFGVSVAVSGDTALVGADHDDNAGGTDAGSAYFFPAGCDSDGDGVPDDQDACPDNAPGLRVDSNGRPLNDCNGDCMADGGDIHCITAEMFP